MNKRVMNLVNFVRGCEPRDPGMDLFTPVVEEMKINRCYGFDGTFLLQYDALIRDDFCGFFKKEADEHTELGLWFEMGRAITEAVGIEWRGRPGYDWDWFVNPGFLPAYTPEERERIIDEAFAKFYEVFGYYPKVAGSWLLDSHSVAYMSEKYKLSAICICREQYAVDAYTLWGGYYNGAYFPSKFNVLCPSQTKETAVETPVFRMLGIDPIYGYDENKYNPSHSGCYTMEPVWTSGKTVVDWYLKEYYKNPCLALSYATTGQENSFGWGNIRNGYELQAKLLYDMVQKGEVSVEKLGDTGNAISSEYRQTPAEVLSAFDDWAGNGINSVWYSCKNYRADLFNNNGELFFRDITKFDDRYEERYLKAPCTSWDARYDNLPVVDGRLWSRDGHECGLMLAGDKKVKNIKSREESGNTLAIDIVFDDGDIGRIRLSEDGITITGCGDITYKTGVPDAVIAKTGDTLRYEHNGYPYAVSFSREPEESDGVYRFGQDELYICMELR